MIGAYSGTVKFYDHPRKYGIIGETSAGRDIFFNSAVREASGKVIMGGWRVSVTAVQIPNRGLQATEFLDAYFPDGVRERTGKWHLGRLRFYNELRGYGFVAIDGESDVFIHAERLRKVGMIVHPFKDRNRLLMLTVRENAKGRFAINAKWCETEGVEA